MLKNLPLAFYTLALLVMAYSPRNSWALPTFSEVQSEFQSSETYILSREGEVLQRLRRDKQVRRGEWIALPAIPLSLQLAMLASEDQRFYTHNGVDWKAVSTAAWDNLWNTKTRGASTITMQLAGLLDSDVKARNSGRTLGKKLGQALIATQLERHWSKDQILEAYLNLLPFKGELVGIDALSKTLFGKAAQGLDAVEAAITAALVRSPNATATLVAQRACRVWQDVTHHQSTPAATADCTTVQWRTEQALRTRLWPASEGIAPHWAQYVLANYGQDQTATPKSFTTTLSAQTQALATKSLQRHLRELQGQNVQDGAVVVLDNHTGEVLAWVGSSGTLSQAQEVDGVLALRQPGSTLKPFLYAQALDEQRLTAASLLEDSSAQIATASGLYIPQNYDHRFKGWVSMRMALASSLNVPAVRTLAIVTPDAFFLQLQSLGLALRESAGYYGYSLALGSAEVSLLRLTNAYRALANGGKFSAVAQPLQKQLDTMPAQRTLSTQAAFIIGNILSDTQARAPTFGLDSVLSTRFWTAVKTGTSKDMRDNWAVGWSQRYTVGVWVGNASGEAMHSVSGSSGAAPIWADIMAGLHKKIPSHPPPPPSGLTHQQVHFIPATATSYLEPDRHEWFIAGTQQGLFHEPQSGKKLAATAGKGRIDTPTHGTVLALDPDIPPQRQLLRLQASRSQVNWFLDGKKIGSGAHIQWQPWPGHHVFQLKSADGQLLDEITLEVRGAAVKAP